MINLSFQVFFWSSSASIYAPCLGGHQLPRNNQQLHRTTAPAAVTHWEAIKSCLEFLKCVYVHSPFLPPITPLCVELQAADVCLPSHVRPLSVVSVSQSQIEMHMETHQTVLPSCITTTMCTAMQIFHSRQFILTFYSWVAFSCPFAAPLISITHFADEILMNCSCRAWVMQHTPHHIAIIYLRGIRGLCPGSKNEISAP